MLPIWPSAGADYLCDLAAGNQGRTIIALSGGNTPKPLYQLLGAGADQVPPALGPGPLDSRG